MPAGRAVSDPAERTDVIAELQELRDPSGVDPAESLPLGPEDDAIEICAAVYALPEPFRECHRSGLPLLWPWPSGLYCDDLARRDELLLAAAYLLAAVDRIDLAAAAPVRRGSRRGRRAGNSLRVVDDGRVGQ